MNERPHWRLLNDGEEPPAGRFARDLGDGRRAWFDDDLDDEADVVVITFFINYAATVKREERHSLEALAELIRTTTADTKERLPWLKLARFGDIRSDKNSLRHNDNVIAISGVEVDYDAEQVGFDDAARKLAEACIAAIVYTSPSHTEDAPRWRVLCPLSREYPPDHRDPFMARLNGLLGGIVANESWTLSQSYYYGAIKQSPSHQVVVLDGTPLDLAHHLDATAIGKPVKPEATTRPVYPAADPSKITDKRVNGKIQSLLDNIRNAADGAKHHTLWDNALAIGGYLHLTDWTDEQAVEECIAALPSAKDWDLARRTGAEALAKGRLKPLHLEERPLPPRRNGAASPELHPDEQQDQPAGDTNDGVPSDWLNAHPPADEDAGAGPTTELITEQVVMLKFVDRFCHDLRFNHSSGSWLTWVDHYWKPDERKLAFAWSLNLCRQLAQTITGKGRAKGRLVVEKVRFSAAVEQAARAVPPISTAQGDWDADPWLLGTPGGVVDLKTGILRDGARDDMITKVTAVTPATVPDCPLWLAFLDFATDGDDAMSRFIQRFCGYCLTGVTIEEIILFLFGLAGSGKSTLVETLAGIMGDYAGNCPMEVFTASNWNPKEYYRADMAGKRLLVASEPERGAFWAEAFVKEITGGDKLSGRHPAGRPFKFDPTHKPLLHGNHMPRLRGRSTAMERRLRIAPFNHKPEKPDHDLKAKLRDERPNILRWMIEGCMAWQKIGLDPPDAISAANTQYFEAQDVFARWVDECCIVDRYLQLEPAPLRKSFNDWARANGEDELGGNAFAEAIDQFECIPPLKRVASHGKRWIKGLGLKPPPATGRYGSDPGDGGDGG